MSKNFNKFLISIFAVSSLAFGAFHNNASASFWDLFKIGNNSQETQQTQPATAIANAETTYKWVNNGLVSQSDGRYTGTCGDKTLVKTYTCDSSTKGNKLYDGTDRGSSYNDTGNAWPIYEGENTSTATEYTYNTNSCGLTKRTGGTVNEWECKSSDSTTTSGSSSNSSSSSSANHTASTGSATNITSTSATLNGTVNPKGEDVSYVFSYYKSGSSSIKTTTWKSAGSGSDDVSVSADISDLSSGTTYYYYISAYSYTTKKYASVSAKSFTTSGGSSSSSAKSYTLKVKINGSGRGKVISATTNESGVGIACLSSSKGNNQGDCEVKFKAGARVQLEAKETDTNYSFGIWGKACGNSGTSRDCALIMSQDRDVSATFNVKGKGNGKDSVVSVTTTGGGVGKVISVDLRGNGDGAINCGTRNSTGANDCSETYKTNCGGGEGGEVICGKAYFKAIPQTGSTFGGWGGDCLSFVSKNAKDQCYVNLDGAKTITASFNEGSNNPEGKNYNLTVTVSKGGKVESSDNKISCDSSNSPCKQSYGKNGIVTLKLTPNSGYVVSSTGGCNNDKTKNSDGSYNCKVKMTANQNVTVNFKASGTSSSSSSQTATVKIKNVGTGMGYAFVYRYKDSKNNYVETCRLGSGSTCEVEQSVGNALRIWAKPYQSSFESWESGCESIQKASVSGDLCNITVSSSGNSINVNFTKSSSSDSSSSSSQG